DHDARHPLARAPSLYQDAAGNLQEKVTDEEDAHAEAVNVWREVQRAGHLQGGVPDINAVKISDHVKQKEVRENAPRDAPPRSQIYRTVNCYVAAHACDCYIYC